MKYLWETYNVVGHFYLLKYPNRLLNRFSKSCVSVFEKKYLSKIVLHVCQSWQVLKYIKFLNIVNINAILKPSVKQQKWKFKCSTLW